RFVRWIAFMKVKACWSLIPLPVSTVAFAYPNARQKRSSLMLMKQQRRGDTSTASTHQSGQTSAIRRQHRRTPKNGMECPENWKPHLVLMILGRHRRKHGCTHTRNNSFSGTLERFFIQLSHDTFIVPTF